MSDSIYTHDFLLESGVEIKQESPFELGSMSASVPIPQRRVDLGDFNTDLDLCLQDNLTGSFHNVPNMQYSKLAFDNENSTKNETFKMDDDDIFQVDKADLILGPTLAELNANPDTLLEDLNFDDLLLPDESGYCIQIGGVMSGSRRAPNAMQVSSTMAAESPCSPYSRAQLAFSPSSQHSSASSSFAQPMTQLPELLHRLDGYSGEIALGQSVPASTVLPPFPTSVKPQHTQLSSSAPTHLTMEQVFILFLCFLLQYLILEEYI
jgi:CREB3 regulatory factor